MKWALTLPSMIYRRKKTNVTKRLGLSRATHLILQNPHGLRTGKNRMPQEKGYNVSLFKSCSSSNATSSVSSPSPNDQQFFVTLKKLPQQAMDWEALGQLRAEKPRTGTLSKCTYGKQALFPHSSQDSASHSFLGTEREQPLMEI